VTARSQPAASLRLIKRVAVKNQSLPSLGSVQQRTGRPPPVGKRLTLRYIRRMASSSKPKLLSSGNPQIPKGEGDKPVKAYIKAMPGCKKDVGEQLDAIVERVFPEVTKAVKWNTPLYGNDGGWFFSMYCFKKYIKLSFMRGTSLKPEPPVSSKMDGIRYYHIYEDAPWDEKQVTDWIRQASRIPGEKF